MSDMPELVKVKAIDVKPDRWAEWCSVGGGAPYANVICHRRWSEDGKSIWFMLESHNFLNALPDEVLELVPYRSAYTTDERLAESDAADEVRMAVRPPAKACPTCGTTVAS